MPTYKKYIYTKEVSELDRPDMTFGDPTKIRMSSDPIELGVRLVGSFNTTKLAYDYPTDDDISVTLPLWSPQSVKDWLLFEEISNKPDGTTITWRVSDGTDTFYYDGSSWVAPTLDTHWNTEQELSDNISTFPWTQKKIQFIAKLKTTDQKYTPILYGYSLLINCDVNWVKDILVDSFVPYIREHFQIIVDYSGHTTSDIDEIDFANNPEFKPKQPFNIVTVDAVYDYDDDPNYETDLLDSYNSSTQVATLNSTVSTDTTLFIKLKIEPEIIIKAQHSDYLEIAKTPAIVIESIGLDGNNTKAPTSIVDKGNSTGWKTDFPYLCNITLSCEIIDPLINETFDLMSKAYNIVDSGLGNKRHLLHTKGLDRYFGISNKANSTYSPRPNFTNTKTFAFGLIIHNVYLYTREPEEKPIVTNINFTTTTTTTEGPFEESKKVSPGDFPGGSIWFLLGFFNDSEEQ